MSAFLRLAALLAVVQAVFAAPAATDCTGSISSLDDVDDAVKCTTVNINMFTVPAGETFNLDLADGTTVNMSASPTPPPPSSPPRPLAPQAAWRRRPPIARLNGRLARLQWRCNYSRGGS